MRRTPYRYTGATKSIDLAAARALGRRWAVQEKVDGCYVRVVLDARGRVGHVFTRNEREVDRSQLACILGAELGRPHAELVGELEAHTEAGNAAADARGQRLVHLFDCLHDGERSLAKMPYSARRDVLWRMTAEVECYGERSPWVRDDAGRAHDARSGRYTQARLTGWRVAPIVPQAPISQLERLWGEFVVEGEREGLVLVNLDAPAGARASKLKLKPVETLDVVAVAVSRTVVTCEWRGSLFNVGRGRHHVELGDLVEVRHCGWYGGGQVPRFPGLVRVRRDILQ
jgi:ATP-dependent DNA ligase